MKFFRTLFKKVSESDSLALALEREMRQHMNDQESGNDSVLSLDAQMQQLLNGPGPDEFYSAMLNLQKLGAIALPRLKDVTVDSTQPSGFRARALETAATIGGDDIGSFLIQCATDPEFQVRYSAVAMIGKLRIREALPVLKEMLISDNSEWEVQRGFVLNMKKGVTKSINSIESESK